MNRSSFLKLLAAGLYPTLRAQGFRGSGTTLRRLPEPIVHVFHFQGSANADRYYLNLGAHLSFLPPEGGLQVPCAKFDDAHCIFRARIDPPAPAYAWHYGHNEGEALSVIQNIAAQWQQQAVPFFSAYSPYPAAFLGLVSVHVPVGNRTTLHFARIAVHLGLIEQAVTFAREGLVHTPERASLLRSSFAVLLKKLSAA